MTTQQILHRCFRLKDPALTIWRRKKDMDDAYEQRKNTLCVEFLAL